MYEGQSKTQREFRIRYLKNGINSTEKDGGCKEHEPFVICTQSVGFVFRVVTRFNMDASLTEYTIKIQDPS
jgi:hypothetical protein